MKRIFISIALCIMCAACTNRPTDVGQGFVSKRLYAPWLGKNDNTRFCCHSTSERLFFSFDVEDTTLVVLDDFKEEKDVNLEDRVEIFFSADPSLKSGYYCAEIDPAGHIMDYKAWPYRKFNFDWNFSGMDAQGTITSRGYSVCCSISRREIENLSIDLDNGFWLGVFRGDCHKNGDIEWYSLVYDQTDKADFHIPGVLFECRARPKAERF